MKFRSLMTAICVLAAAQIVSAAPYAYIANSGTKNVSVIDTADNTVKATVPLPPNGYLDPTKHPNAYAITVGASGQYVYVGLKDTNEVAIIDTSTNTVVQSKRILLGADVPGGLAVNAAETRLYVTSNMSNTLIVIDISGSGAREVGRVAVHDSPLSNPEGVVLNSTGTKAYVANSTKDSIAEITLDVVNNSYVRSSIISSGADSYPMGLAISSDDSKLYFASFNGNTGVVDLTASPKTVTSLPTDSGNLSVAINPVSGNVYAPSSVMDTLYAFNSAGTPLGSYATAATGPWGSSVTPNPASKLFVAMNLNNTVKVYNTANLSTPPASIDLTPTAGAGAKPTSLGNFIGPIWDHTIKSTSTPGCTITPGALSPGLNVPVNSYGLNFTIAGTGCYVTVNSTPVGMVTSYKMTNVTDNTQTITASQVPSFSVTADWTSAVNGFLISTNSNNPQGQNIDESTKNQPVFFPQGTTVYVKAGGTGFSATNWTGACAGTTGPVCTLSNLNANKTVGAIVTPAAPGGSIKNETTSAFYADWAACAAGAASYDHIKVSTDISSITTSGTSGYMYYMCSQWKPDFSGQDTYHPLTLTITNIGVTVSTEAGDTLTL